MQKDEKNSILQLVKKKLGVAIDLKMFSFKDILRSVLASRRYFQ